METKFKLREIKSKDMYNTFFTHANPVRAEDGIQTLGPKKIYLNNNLDRFR